MGEVVEIITITKKEYEEMKRDSELLSCLEACGVEEWSGWDKAMDMLIND
jgi:hypothetical protein